MKENEELRQQMWDLAYGLLEPGEVAVLHARIKSDPAAARLYAEVRLEADLVAAAAKVEDHSFSVSVPDARAKVQTVAKNPQPSRETSRVPSTSGATNWLAGIAATSLLLLIVYGLYSPRPRSEKLTATYVVTEVQTPGNMPAGLTSKVSITTRDIEDNSRTAEVFVSLTNAQGHEDFRSEVSTDAYGVAEVEIPGAAIQPGAKLRVGQRLIATSHSPVSGQAADANPEQATATSPAVSAELPVQAEPVTPYVVFDKPVYKPGEPVNYVLFGVSRFSKNLHPLAATSWGRFGSTEGLAGGVEMEGHSLAPTGTPAEPIAGTGAVVSGKLLMPDTRPVPSGYAQSGRDLAARGAQGPPGLALSDAVKGAPSLTAPAQNGLKLQAAPSSSAASRARKAAVLAEKSADAALAQPPADGKADFAPPSTVAALPVTIAAGAPIDLALPAPLEQRDLLVVAVCEGIVVSSEKFSPTAVGAEGTARSGSGQGIDQRRRVVSLSVPPEVSGELTVSFFDNSEQPPRLLDERIVYREPLRKWDIAVDGLKAAYAPGEQVRLELRVADENGRPDSAALAVRVWNELLSDQSLAAHSQIAKRPSLDEDALTSDIGATQRKMGSADELVRKQASALEKESLSSAQRNQSEADKTSQAGDPTSQTLGLDADESNLDGKGTNPYVLQANLAPTTLVSNRAEVLAQYQAARDAEERHAKMRTVILGRICLFAGLAVLLLIGMQALMRMHAEAKALIPAIALAAASVALGALWMNPEGEIEKLIAWRSDEIATPPAEARQRADAAYRTDATEPTAVTEAPNDFGNLALSESAEYKARESTSGPAVADSPQPADQSNFGKDAPAADAKGAPGRQDAAGAAAPGATVPAASATPAPPSAPVPAPDALLFRTDRAEQDKLAEAVRPRASRMLRATAEKSTTQKFDAPANDERAALGGRASPQPSIAGEGRSAGEAKDKSSPAVRGGARPAELETRAGKKMPAEQQAENVGRNSPQSGLPAPVSDAELDAGKAGSEAVAPASLYWNPQLATNDQGRAVIEFTMPEVDSTYRVFIDAYGGGRIGSGTAVVVCRKDAANAP